MEVCDGGVWWRCVMEVCDGGVRWASGHQLAEMCPK